MERMYEWQRWVRTNGIISRCSQTLPVARGPGPTRTHGSVERQRRGLKTTMERARVEGFRVNRRFGGEWW